MRNKTLPFIALTLLIVMKATAQVKAKQDAMDRQVLEKLEYRWLKAEFALDTAYLATLLDSSFMGISADGVVSKQQELKAMHNIISKRIADSIFVDSFRLEEMMIKGYGATAVVTFVVHTWGTNKGVPRERKTRFYDVWIKREGKWKAVASQGTPLQIQ